MKEYVFKAKDLQEKQEQALDQWQRQQVGTKAKDLGPKPRTWD